MNVVAGLMGAGELHICLIDSSDVGATFELDGDFERSVIRADELSSVRRAFESLRSVPIMAYKHEADLRDRIITTVADREWDVVWFSRARVHRLCGDLFDGAHILDLDDLNDRLLTTLNADRRARLGFLRSLPKNVLNMIVASRWTQYYQRLGPSVSTVVVCHEGDRRHLPMSNTSIVPNGYPNPTCPPTPRSPGHEMLFVGPLTYEPNYLAVRWFIEEVLDRVRSAVPEARLSVVGDLEGVPESLQHEAVTFHGFVPDVTPYYEQADMAIAPLHSGGGTRIKILEAMARCRPMVATPFAFEGLTVEPDVDLCAADTAEGFAGHCVRLLTDDVYAQSVAERAQRTFHDRLRAVHSRARVTELANSVADQIPISKERGDRS